MPTYLPAITAHFASDRFNALAKSKGSVAEAKGRIRVRSAGSMPASELDTAHGRRRAGIRRGHHHGLRRLLPYYAGKRYEDWNLTDPAGQSLETVREIHDRVKALVGSLLATEQKEDTNA